MKQAKKCPFSRTTALADGMQLVNCRVLLLSPELILTLSIHRWVFLFSFPMSKSEQRKRHTFFRRSKCSSEQTMTEKKMETETQHTS